MIAGSVPILSCKEAKQLEADLLGGDEAKEWQAMERAGHAVARAVEHDSLEIGGLGPRPRILVLVGKGHNGGDAMLAAESLLSVHEDALVDVLYVFGDASLRPLALRASQSLIHAFGKRVRPITASGLADSYTLCLDGIFGFQFRPPIDERVGGLMDRVSGLPIRIRAAIDLPSGGIFRADFTYATGSLKTPVLETTNSGRLRYLDLGFFGDAHVGRNRVLMSAVLSPLLRLRDPATDKRSYGHLFIVAGSRSYPGAVLMAVLSALRSGVGLLTAFVPASLAPAFAARVPEAIWVGCPETAEGGLARESYELIKPREDRATAWVVGPGISRDPETLALVGDVVAGVKGPILLDADALQIEIVDRARSPLILTPHAGEFARLAGAASLEEYSSKRSAVVVLKGPITKIAGNTPAQGRREELGGEEIYHSLFGGPVLARGGSGDLLAGIIGGLLAQHPTEPLRAAVRGTVWHGLAAESLARTHGQVAVNTTQLVDFMPVVLRDLQTSVR